MKLTSIADLQRNDTGEIEKLIGQLHYMYDYYLENFPNDDHSRVPGIHASELVTCKRMVVYTLSATEKRATVPSEWRKRFEVGHAIHNMIQRHFAGMANSSNGKLTFHQEVRVDLTPIAKQLYISSSCDGVFTFFNDQREQIARVGVEIKTISPKDFDSLKAPKDKHIEQAHVYAACLDLPFIWFVYWNKGNQNITPSIKPFLVRFDPHIWARLQQRAQECIAYADHRQLPDREEDTHCAWCPYAWTCQPTLVQERRYEPRRPLPILKQR